MMGRKGGDLATSKSELQESTEARDTAATVRRITSRAPSPRWVFFLTLTSTGLLFSSAELISKGSQDYPGHLHDARQRVEGAVPAFMRAVDSWF